ncbi:MAG: hypothetical protein A3J58_01720 [Candidatus Sungbacteria bacterium RIFCSPHIGHO2_02_FULL_52_23]|uniref:Uncharacterized protein n=1 Tax=Candidatus Sungbacteria bacterium RIFCSPHIGHO2_02_FULL_52_23 TaxID=1802274 RepID=A0A1G2L0G6_9BACT|nr:MAG: hypothetical protein A3J58_01720 [Candidatus Sungbacteria bacterium RIFCSPHIGHO2_02_FULL_52_23]
MKLSSILMTAAEIIVALVAIAGFFYTAFTYHNTTKISRDLNRPYIDLETESVKEDIVRFPRMIPVGNGMYRQIPAEQNLRFSIKNYGTLPAKYKIDLSDFKSLYYHKIPEIVDIDYLYPKQAKERVFTFDSDEEALKRMGEALESGVDLFGDKSKWDDFYIIKIKYGFTNQSEERFPYETIIRRKYINVPCVDGSDVIEPNVRCTRAKWIVEKAI